MAIGRTIALRRHQINKDSMTELWLERLRRSVKRQTGQCYGRICAVACLVVFMTLLLLLPARVLFALHGGSQRTEASMPSPHHSSMFVRSSESKHVQKQNRHETVAPSFSRYYAPSWFGEEHACRPVTWVV